MQPRANILGVMPCTFPRTPPTTTPSVEPAVCAFLLSLLLLLLFLLLPPSPSFRSSLCVRYTPQELALASMYLGAKFGNLRLPDGYLVSTCR